MEFHVAILVSVSEQPSANARFVSAMNVFWIQFNLKNRFRTGVFVGFVHSVMISLLTATQIANLMVQVCRGQYLWQHHANMTTLKWK